MNLISKYFRSPSVPVIKIRGPINSVLVNQIEKQMKMINKHTVKALAIVVNSQTGCPYQTSELSQRIKSFAHDSHVPVYTFAERYAISTGYQLLSIGDKVYAQPSSVVGQLPQTQLHLDYQQTLAHYGIHQVHATTNKNLQAYVEKTMADNGNSRSIAQTKLDDQNQLMDEEVLGNRKVLEKHDAQDRKELWFGKQALTKGLVDEIGSYEAILNKLYPDAKLIPLSKQSQLQRLEDNFYFVLKLTQSKGFLLLIGVLLLKFIIKWTIIITMWRRIRKQKKQQVA